MKISTHQPGPSGFATITILTIVIVMFLLLMANNYTLKWLRQEVTLTDKQQIHRLAPHP